MRTKTLLIAGAALAAAVISTEAQTVYSVNVVGYVNVTLAANGYTAINVPVDFDGTGTNNLVTSVIGTNLPNGSSVLTWNTGAAGYSNPNTFGPTSKNPTPHWSTATAIYNPGQGLFVQNPSNFPVNLTFVGTVLQGGLTNAYLNQAGYSLIGNTFPVAGGITTTYGYVPVNNDTFLAWDPVAQGFANPNVYGPTSKNPTPHWSSGSEPQLVVGQSAFILTTNPAPVMGTNFIVQ